MAKMIDPSPRNFKVVADTYFYKYANDTGWQIPASRLMIGKDSTIIGKETYVRGKKNLYHAVSVRGGFVPFENLKEIITTSKPKVDSYSFSGNQSEGYDRFNSIGFNYSNVEGDEEAQIEKEVLQKEWKDSGSTLTFEKWVKRQKFWDKLKSTGANLAEFGVTYLKDSTDKKMNEQGGGYDGSGGKNGDGGGTDETILGMPKGVAITVGIVLLVGITATAIAIGKSMGASKVKAKTA